MAERDRAAKRRRDRRLCMHWRHEQLTLQMALAAVLHHSRDVGPGMYNALRSQKTARAGERGREMNFDGDDLGPPLPSRSSSASSEEGPAEWGRVGHRHCAAGAGSAVHSGTPH